MWRLDLASEAELEIFEAALRYERELLASASPLRLTGAWNDLRKAMKGDYDDTVWDHLAGTKSAPFEAGDHRQVAVKVIDDRGNELFVVRALT